jgi:hypothetical protein
VFFTRLVDLFSHLIFIAIILSLVSLVLHQSVVLFGGVCIFYALAHQLVDVLPSKWVVCVLCFCSVLNLMDCKHDKYFRMNYKVSGK